MIGIKRRSSIYYPIKEYYKRRIMVGDILGNKTLYADFPDNFVDITNLNETTDNRIICEYNSTSTLNTRIQEYTDTAFEYGIYVGATALSNNIYFYNLETNKLGVNKNEYKMSDTVQDVTEVTDCQAYRHIYIKDPNITFFSDYKSSLQEYIQTTQKSLEYRLVNEEGPAHDKRFTVEVIIDNIVYGEGVGTSKKEAEQEAAKQALDKMATK